MNLQCIPTLSFRVVYLIALMLTFSACNKPDIRLVNRVKSFSPKWSQLNDKFTNLDRNLNTAEEHFEADFAEVEGLLGEIADSLKGRNFRKMLDEYQEIIQVKDSIRSFYDSTKTEYSLVVPEFHDFEKVVTGGDIGSEEGMEELKKYRSIHKTMSLGVDSVTTELSASFDKHNRVLRELCSMMEIFRNFDIRFQ